MFVIQNADHMHFCNRPREVHEMFRTIPRLLALFRLRHMPPFAELCPAKHALMAVRGIALAHFDAVLKADHAAGAFLLNHIMSELSRRGVVIDVER